MEFITESTCDLPPAPSRKFSLHRSVFTGDKQVFVTHRYWNAPTWTQVTSDNRLVHELLQAYFSQETPQRIAIGTSLLLDSMANNRNEHCNSALVNAVLAVGCAFDQAKSIFATPQDCLEAGEAFFRESNWHLSQSAASLMDVQALGVLSKREITIGNDFRATSLSKRCMQLARELNLSEDLSHDLTTDISLTMSFTRLTTFFTNYYCDIIYCILTNTTSCLDASRFGNLTQHKHAFTKYLRSTIDLSSGLFGQELRDGLHEEAAVMIDLFELSLIIEENLRAFFQSEEPLNQDTILRLFAKYQKWYAMLFSDLILSNQSPQRTLLLHCHYYVAILLLFRPFCKVGFSGSQVSPRLECLEAAGMISNIMDALVLRDILRRTSPAMCVFYLSSANLQLIGELPSHEASVYLRRNIRTLKTMLPWNPTAGQSLDYFADLVDYYSVSLDEESMATLQEARRVVDGKRGYHAHRETMQGLLVFMEQGTGSAESQSSPSVDANHVSASEQAMKDRGFVWDF